MVRFDAIIFDMDGVLVDSERYWRPKIRKELKKYVHDWSEEDEKKIVGMNLPTYHAYLKQRGFPLALEPFMKFVNDIALSIYAECPLMPNVQETLSRLKEQGVRIALASSSQRNWIDFVCDHWKFDFEVIVTGNEVEQSKPAPDIYKRAAEQLDLPFESIAAIEDSKNGILSAKAAGLFCYGYSYDFNKEQDLSKADEIVTDLLELLHGK